MDKDDLYGYVSNKIAECGNYIVFSYYDVRVRHNVSNDELQDFLEDAEEILEEKGYKVYFENEKYTYNGSNRIVQCSEVLVAIKEENK